MSTLKRLLIILPLFIAIAWVWFSYPEWLILVLDKNSGEALSQKGIIGDAYGALNTLFSGLAFAGIIVSIVLQSAELAETRKEIKEQKDQFIIQNSSLKRQVFENTFFQLIHLHNEITDAVVARKFFENDKDIKGRAAFSVLLESFIRKEHHHVTMPNPAPESRQDDYMLFHYVHHDRIGHYFRNIYQIIKFIDTSDLEKKQFYVNLLRAQMSSNELGLLFYNCASQIGSEKFKPLLEKYEFFEHLPPYSHFTKEDIKLYNVSVFGESKEWSEFIRKLWKET